MSNPIEYLHVVDAYDSEWVPVSADVGVGAVICTFRPTSDNEPVVVAVVSRGRYLVFRRACEVAGGVTDLRDRESATDDQQQVGVLHGEVGSTVSEDPHVADVVGVIVIEHVAGRPGRDDRDAEGSD